MLVPRLRLVGTEYVLTSGDKLDMLARDRKTRQWVVIELKPDLALEDVVSEIVGYMVEVATAPPSKRGNAGVRGMIITARSDPVLRDQVKALARAEGLEVEWMTYRVEMVLEPTGTSSA